MIKSQKDFWTGVLYIGFGAAALWVGHGYKIGSASRMGPGYFPTVLAGLLIFFGALALLRSVRKAGAPIGAVAWKPAAIVLLAMALFGFLLERAGLVISLVLLIVGSASASGQFRFEWRASLLAIVLIAFCVLVFSVGLGLPMPLVGSWFAH
jgi:hypothetical protein